MKTIFIMRHAESDWENSNFEDFDRPLNTEGFASAPRMGNILYRIGVKLDLIISSPAKRAKQTAVLVSAGATIPTKMIFEDELYSSSPNTLLKTISRLKSDCDTVLLIGHNPGIEGLVLTLTGKLTEVYPASIVEIKLNLQSWDKIAEKCGIVGRKLSPNELAENGAIQA
jgi:phosphohistidine phosphatase